MPLLQKAYLGSTALFKETAWFESFAALLASTGSATLTASTTAHTKGAYSELISSNANDSDFIIVTVNDVTATGANTATLLDIATGASGSETVLVENVAVGGAAGAAAGALLIQLPVKIASGTRISGRIQSVVTGGKTALVQIYTYTTGSYNEAPSSVNSIGANTSLSRGVVMSGASGTWVQLTASTSQQYRGVAIIPALCGNFVASNARLEFEVGVGASGSEVAFGTTTMRASTAEAIFSVSGIQYFARDIPSGSRIAVKHNISSDPANYCVSLIGIP